MFLEESLKIVYYFLENAFMSKCMNPVCYILLYWVTFFFFFIFFILFFIYLSNYNEHNLKHWIFITSFSFLIHFYDSVSYLLNVKRYYYYNLLSHCAFHCSECHNSSDRIKVRVWWVRLCLYRSKYNVLKVWGYKTVEYLASAWRSYNHYLSCLRFQLRIF